MEKTYELCPECGREVMLKAECTLQLCPECGKLIVACSMCEAMDCAHCEVKRKGLAKLLADEWGPKDATYPQDRNCAMEYLIDFYYITEAEAEEAWEEYFG